MHQIIEGVLYMHEKFIMHLDMKPENILCVTRTGNRIKLIDFGLARRYDPNRTLQVMFGTPDFAAPEVLSYERVTPAADMWSVGVICYVLLSGLSPFMGNSDLETMTNVTRAIYDFDDDSFDPISDEAKDFISKLLIKDPTKRLKPNECLNHKWLAKTPVRKGKVQQLDKTKLKKYVVRRRWQKAVTAIMALSRMGANLSLTGAKRDPSSHSVSTTKSTSKTSTSTSTSSAKSKTKPTTAPATRTIRVTTISSSNNSSSKTPPSTTTLSSNRNSSITTRAPQQVTTSTSPAVSRTTALNSTTSSSLSSSQANSRFAPSPTTPSRTSASTSTSSSYRIHSSTLSTTRRKF